MRSLSMDYKKQILLSNFTLKQPDFGRVRIRLHLAALKLPRTGNNSRQIWANHIMLQLPIQSGYRLTRYHKIKSHKVLWNLVFSLLFLRLLSLRQLENIGNWRKTSRKFNHSPMKKWNSLTGAVASKQTWCKDWDWWISYRICETRVKMDQVSCADYSVII